MKSNSYDVSPYNHLSKSGFRNILEGFVPLHGESINLHNRVHVYIGGDMSSVPIAPNDPIFFLHYCNVDRIWAIWQDKNSRELSIETTTYPKNSSTGQNLKNKMAPWIDASNSRTPAQVLNFRNLGYTYEGEHQNWPSIPTQLFGDWGTPQSVNMIATHDKIIMGIVSGDNCTHISWFDGNNWAYPKPIFSSVQWQTPQAMSLIYFKKHYYLNVISGGYKVYQAVTKPDNLWEEEASISPQLPVKDEL